MSSNLTQVLSFWKKLNKNQDWLHSTNNSTENINENDPITKFIQDEKIFAICLIQNIHKSLSAINRITRGTTLPKPEDIENIDKLNGYQVRNIII